MGSIVSRDCSVRQQFVQYGETPDLVDKKVRFPIYCFHNSVISFLFIYSFSKEQQIHMFKWSSSLDSS